MKHRSTVSLALAVCLLMVPVPLLAQPQRTFVSAASGSDANPCTRALPCRNFAQAISQTLEGGEVIVLDSGGYGTATISGAISLISPSGVYAGVTALAFVNAITVNAGATDNVVLRGLTLHSFGSGDKGINVQAVGALHVEQVTINGFDNFGIDFSLSASGELYLKDSISRSNGYGIRIYTSSGAAAVFIDHSRFENNDVHGMLLLERGRADVHHSVFAGSGGDGVLVEAFAGSTTAVLNAEGCSFIRNFRGVAAGTAVGAGNAFATVGNSLISSNFLGVDALANSTIRLSRNLVSANGTGLNNTAGTLESAGDNAVRGNTTETSGAITLFSPI